MRLELALTKSATIHRAKSMTEEMTRILELAQNEALRSSRVLAVLDMKRARACTDLADSARSVVTQLECWRDTATTKESRKATTVEFQRCIEEAARLGLTSWG